MTGLTLDILDDAIKAVEEVRHKDIAAIYLNPIDWADACKSMEKVSGMASVNVRAAFGIPVVLSPTLERGMFVLAYSTSAYNTPNTWILTGFKTKP